MNDDPHDNDPNFPDGADAFLASLLHEKAQQDVFYLELDMNDIPYQQRTMDVLERYGINVRSVRATQAASHPDAPLSVTIDHMESALADFEANEEIDPGIKEILRTKTEENIWLARKITSIASGRSLADMSGYNRSFLLDEQARIIVADDIMQEEKTKWLAALDELYPEYEGLDMNDPDSILYIETYRMNQEKNLIRLQKQNALAQVVDSLVLEYTQGEGISPHDDLREALSPFVTALRRRHVLLQTGAEQSEIESIDYQLGLGTRMCAERLSVMGWSAEQVAGLLPYLEQRLQQLE